MTWRLGRLFFFTVEAMFTQHLEMGVWERPAELLCLCMGSPAAGTIHQGLDDDRDTEELEFIFAWLICFVYSQGVNLSSMIPQNGFSSPWAMCL